MDDIVSDVLDEARFAEMDKLRRENARLRSTLEDTKAHAKRVGDTLGRTERALDVALGTQDQYHTREYETLKKKHSRGTSVVLVLSDFHGEEEVKPETINGRNKYTLAIAEKRLERTFQKAVMLTDFVRHLAPVDEIVVALLGDFLTGHIHDELVETCQLSPTDAVVWLEGLLVSGLEHLAAQTKCKSIRVVTALGNHGRDTPKQRIATESNHSYEWIVYNHLRSYLKKQTRIHWQIERGYHHWAEIQGRAVRFHHGHFLRYGGGVGGLTIPVLKAISKWDQERPAHLDIFGHWHQQFSHSKFFVNGSIIGWSPFAVKIKADYQDPMQGFLVFDKQYGCTMSMPIFCETPEFFEGLRS